MNKYINIQLSYITQIKVTHTVVAPVASEGTQCGGGDGYAVWCVGVPAAIA